MESRNLSTLKLSPKPQQTATNTSPAVNVDRIRETEIVDSFFGPYSAGVLVHQPFSHLFLRNRVLEARSAHLQVQSTEQTVITAVVHLDRNRPEWVFPPSSAG